MDDYEYYHCHENCNLCDGYGHLNDSAPEECPVIKRNNSPGTYAIFDSSCSVACYLPAESPDDAKTKGKERIKIEKIKIKGKLDDIYVTRILI